MKDLLLGRRFLSLIGVLLLCALVFFLFPAIAIGDSHPFDSILVRAGICLALLLGWGAYAFLSWRKGRANEERLEAAVTGAAAPKDDSAQAITADQAAQADKLKAALADLKKANEGKGAGLYDFPWYAIIGPPGAGKTTALLNSGLRFPLAERHGAGALSGVGGTRNCDWWFTDNAVILDTAGRYTTQDSAADIDKAGWQNFLRLLKETRPRQPLNGVLLVFGLTDLLNLPAAERTAHARAVRTRLIELQEAFGVRLPVYLLFTKLDLLAGFADHFDDLDREAREQVLGFTFPLDESGRGDAPWRSFAEYFDRLLARLDARLPERLHVESDLARRASSFGFPAQFASLKAPVGELIAEAFDDSRFAQRPMLRGVYFASATQDGTPIDRLMGALSARFGTPRAAVAPQQNTGRGYFLRRLFESVVFNEAGLVGRNPAAEKNRTLLRTAGFAASAVVALGLIGAWTWSFLGNRSLIDRTAEAVQATEDDLRRAAALPLSGDPMPVLPTLDRLRALPSGFADTAAETQLAPGLGLAQQQRLSVTTQGIYRRALTNLLLPRLATRAQERLAQRVADPEFAFAALKTYLMLGDPGNLDPAWLADWFATEWVGLPSDRREALLGHLSALTAEPWAGFDLDQGLIADARQNIARLSPAQRALRTLADNRDVRALPPWRVIDNAGPQAAQGLTRKTGRPLTEGVPGLYTRRGYWTVLVPNIPRAVRQTAADSWVLNTDAPGAADQAQISREILGVYAENYIRAWEDLLNDVTLTQPPNLRATADLLLIVSGSTSPFAQFYRAAARETRLSEIMLPPGVPASGPPADLARRAAQPFSDAAQPVDDRFKWLADFTGPDTGPGPMADFLRRLEDIGRRAGAIAVAGGGGSAADLQRVIAELQVEAARLPPVVAAAAGGVATTAGQLGAAAARGQMAQIYATDVLPLCRALTNQRYPFVRAAQADAPIEDFARLFAPSGLFDQFFRNQLAQYVNTAGQTWTMNPNAAVTIQPAALAQFQRAAAIRDAFFPPASTLPAVQFALRPRSVGTLAKATLEFDGQVFVADGGPASSAGAQMQWPRGLGGARAQLEAATVAGQPAPPPAVITQPGVWALFRFLQAQSLRRVRDDLFTFDAGGAVFEIQASLRNPFLLLAGNQLGQFQCPTL
jgi:type VI secretion system protein ImpL